SSTSPGPLGSMLTASFPQVEEATRVVPPYENSENVLVVREDKRFFENRIFFVDNAAFRIFHMPFLKGGPETALTRPHTVVLTESMAEKYFDEEDPIGQILQIEIDYDTGQVELQDYEVTGVIKNAPSNTHFKYDMLLSMPTLIVNLPSFDEDWINFHEKYTYIKLGPKTDAANFEKQLDVAAQNVSRQYEERFERTIQLFEFQLQPITRIHMYSRTMNEMEPPGNWYYISIYSIVALLVLLIGCMNFVNMSAALSVNRGDEVALRKVIGAKRSQLIRQFLGESFLITILGFIVAIGLVTLLLIPFNRMAGTELSAAGLLQPVVLFSIIGLLLLVAIGSGAYPAFILTSFRPAHLLQGKAAPRSHRSGIQKFLVVGQFAISIFLVICTLVVFKQLRYMRGQALGFDIEQKLILRVKSNMDHLRRDYENIKNDFLAHPSIIGATVSSRIPGDREQSGYYMTTKAGDYQDALRLLVVTTDYDFIREYGLKMAAGRPFDRSLGNDENGAYVITRAGALHMGFSTPEEALGKQFQASYHRKTKEIVGVIEDFHILGMREEVEPLLLDIETSLFDTITLAVNIKDIRQVMAHVKKTWNNHFPGVPFASTFLDDNFDQVYRYEDQMSRMLSIIAVLGFIIACLGLFGLATFMVHNRVKEIGIRKVLGARTREIVSMLSGKFILLILLSIGVACPAAFFAMTKWLQDFAYRVDMGAIIFIAASIGALLIAFTTVSLQGIRATAANPADSLRNE
ncbi:MAG: ABC transporter permease, partial [Candidatus Aminicenantes bacterium]|nr:ABC transporter permease [Candidatus Aminicenantes bacterium]